MANKRITSAVLAALYKAIEDGATVTDAALVANISRQAYYDLIRAEKAKPTSQILDRIAQAKAKHRRKLQSLIMKAGNQSWQACAWLLERKYPSIFGKSDRLFAQQLRELRQEIIDIRADIVMQNISSK